MLVRLTKKFRMIANTDRIDYIVFVGPSNERRLMVSINGDTSIVSQELLEDEEMDEVMDEIEGKIVGS